MKFLFIILFQAIFLSVNAQDSLRRLYYLNQYELSGYWFAFLDHTSDDSPFWEGTELNVNLISYQVGRHEMGISSGMFFIDKRPDKSSNPHLQYFYFPVNLSYTLYSKSRRVYGKIVAGTPLLTYEGSKQLADGSFWLNYETASNDYNYPKRKKLYGIYQLRFGYRFTEHIGINAGAMYYMYSTDAKNVNSLLRLALGLEFRL